MTLAVPGYAFMRSDGLTVIFDIPPRIARAGRLSVTVSGSVKKYKGAAGKVIVRIESVVRSNVRPGCTCDSQPFPLFGCEELNPLRSAGVSMDEFHTWGGRSVTVIEKEFRAMETADR